MNARNRWLLCYRVVRLLSRAHVPTSMHLRVIADFGARLVICAVDAMG